MLISVQKAVKEAVDLKYIPLSRKALIILSDISIEYIDFDSIECSNACFGA